MLQLLPLVAEAPQPLPHYCSGINQNKFAIHQQQQQQQQEEEEEAEDKQLDVTNITSRRGRISNSHTHTHTLINDGMRVTILI